MSLIAWMDIDGATMLEHIKAYFDRFGTKPCCFEDLQPYVDTVLDDTEEVSSFINDLRSLVHLDTEDVSRAFEIAFPYTKHLIGYVTS
jgi:N-acetyltransferase B complex (NatB) non catalytic subunit